MATEVGSAYVTILPSARGFQSKLQRELSGPSAVEGDRAGGVAGQRFSNSFSKKLGSQAKAMFGVLARGAGYGALAIGAAGVAAVGFGLKTASAMEQAQVGFTTMLGSAKRAHAFLLRLRDFANKTPFEFADVTRASQRLLAMGFQAKQVLPTLTAIGDAAAGLGIGAQGIDQITTAIGQMQAKGKVQSDELLQLTEAGIPALRILAAGFGTTTAHMQEMVTKGMVPSNKAIPILIRGIEKGTKSTAKFGGLMAKQSKTLGGLWSTFKDTISTGLATAVQPLVPILEKLLPGAMTTLQHGFAQAAVGFRVFVRVMQGADGPSRGFAGRVADVAKFLRDQFIPTVKRIWSEAAPALGKFITKAAALGTTLWPSIKPILTLAGGAALGGLKTLTGLMGTLADHATVAKDAFKIVAALFVAKKLGGLLGGGGKGRGGGGLLGGLLSSAKPLPVFVTNMAGGGLPGGGPGGKRGKGGRTLPSLGGSVGFIAAPVPSLKDSGLTPAKLRQMFGVDEPGGGAKQSRTLNRLLVTNLGLTKHSLAQARALSAALGVPTSTRGVRAAQTTKHGRLDADMDTFGARATRAPVTPQKLTVPQPTWLGRFLAGERQPASITIRGDLVVNGASAKDVIRETNRHSRVRALSGTPSLTARVT